jgi:hydrogenase expression/formation protein HypC
MCIGIPMQVSQSEPGYAWVMGRGETRKVNTRLVGETAAGEWLLVFLEDARESITSQRATEVNAMLDLLQEAMGTLGGSDQVAHLNDDPGFALPSAMNIDVLRQLIQPS